jgi:hypothetical protein
MHTYLRQIIAVTIALFVATTVGSFVVNWSRYKQPEPVFTCLSLDCPPVSAPLPNLGILAGLPIPMLEYKGRSITASGRVRIGDNLGFNPLYMVGNGIFWFGVSAAAVAVLQRRKNTGEPGPSAQTDEKPDPQNR